MILRRNYPFDFFNFIQTPYFPISIVGANFGLLSYIDVSVMETSTVCLVCKRIIACPIYVIHRLNQ